MGTVISINAHPRRFQPGRAAIHRIHGWCEIVSAQGDARTIRWFEHVPVAVPSAVDHSEASHGVADSEIIEEELIVTREEVVSADELRAV